MKSKLLTNLSKICCKVDNNCISNLNVNKIVIHCSATRNGVSLRRNGLTSAQVIDGWHKQRGFKRHVANVTAFNSNLKSIGYHFVIDVDGTIETGRRIGEVGAHVKNHNTGSLGICLVGGITKEGKNHGEYTKSQWESLSDLTEMLVEALDHPLICGHRDLSPDKNGDGKITRDEWIKDCPCFSVSKWWDSEEVYLAGHMFE